MPHLSVPQNLGGGPETMLLRQGVLRFSRFLIPPRRKKHIPRFSAPGQLVKPAAPGFVVYLGYSYILLYIDTTPSHLI